MADKLTDKQKRFCDEYLIDLNATQAAIRAGYSEKTANEQAARLLANVSIQQYIQKRIKDREKRTEITQDMVLKELAHIAFDDIKNYLSYKTVKTVVGRDEETGEPIIDYKTIVELKDSDTIDTRNIAEISISANGTFKFKQYCKDQALIKLGEHLGMFRQNINLTGGLNNHNVNEDITNLSADERKARIAELLNKMQDK